MKTTLMIILAIFFAAPQSEITLKADQSSMQVLGTSSIHDWESDVEDLTVKGQLSEQNLIKDLLVEVKVKSIKSGKSIMDGKTYDALMADEYPLITFKASSLKVAGNTVSGNGSLSMAGESKPISINATITERTNSTLKIKGAVKLKMTDFEIDPPTAMFGTLVTGDEVTIDYNLLLGIN